MSALSTISTPSPQPSAIDRALFSRAADTSKSDFAAVIGRFHQQPDESPEDLARSSAEQFVSMTFVQPLLKQLRESDHSAPPFAPSQGEKQFQGLMDAQISQRIVRAAHFPLVDRLAHDMLSKAQAKKGIHQPQAAKTAATP